MKYFKNKKVLLNLIYILLVFSFIFLISFIFDLKIKKEAENLEYNRFLKELSTLINNLEFDKISENKDKKRYEVTNNDNLVSIIYIEEGKGVSGNYKIAIVYEIVSDNEYIINNFKVIESSKKDNEYVLKVESNEQFKNNIINKDINDLEDIDIVSGATITSNEIIKAINSSKDKLLDKGNINE